MSDTQANTQLDNMKATQDLFGRAHDYIASASHPGHMALKVAEVLNFLKFQYDMFKQQIEKMEKEAASKVDVPAAKAAIAEVLTPDSPAESR